MRPLGGILLNSDFEVVPTFLYLSVPEYRPSFINLSNPYFSAPALERTLTGIITE